jgi:radical SAM protein with 4Fe4S-binding SPASM domain
MLLDRPYALWVQPTRRSNQDSVLSYDPPELPRDARELSFDEIAALLTQAFDDGVSLFFEGGEPFLRDDMVEILDLACRSAFTMVRTNGTLVDADLARRLYDVRVGVACVDLHSADPATHDRLVGDPGAHAKTVAALGHLVDAGVDPYITCILNRHIAGQLQGVLDLAAELEVPKVSVLRLYALGRARQHWDELSLPLPEQMRALRAVEVPDGVKLLQSWHPHDPNCCWQTAAVDAYGNSIGCPYLREYTNYGNVRDVPFLETWEHPLYKRIRRTGTTLEGTCPDCTGSEGKHSRGGCRSSAYAFTGSWEAPDPHCEVMNDGIDLTRLPDFTRDLPYGPAPVADREAVGT